MPYITPKDRLSFEEGLSLLMPQTAGELNYIFTRIVIKYLRVNGENYQNYNDIIGALEGCKLELYRRHIAPYEAEKIKSNGDVF